MPVPATGPSIPVATTPGRTHISVNVPPVYVDVPARLQSVPPVENMVSQSGRRHGPGHGLHGRARLLRVEGRGGVGPEVPPRLCDQEPVWAHRGQGVLGRGEAASLRHGHRPAPQPVPRLGQLRLHPPVWALYVVPPDPRAGAGGVGPRHVLGTGQQGQPCALRPAAQPHQPERQRPAPPGAADGGRGLRLLVQASPRRPAAQARIALQGRGRWRRGTPSSSATCASRTRCTRSTTGKHSVRPAVQHLPARRALGPT